MVSKEPPVVLDWRRFAQFEKLDEGKWRVTIDALQLEGLGSTPDAAYQALHRSFVSKMDSDAEFRKRVGAFIQRYGTASSWEEFGRAAARSSLRGHESGE